MRIRSFGPEPPPDDLLPEATWSSQQLGCRLEEFNEGWQALLAPCGRLSPGLPAPSWEWCASSPGQPRDTGQGKVVLVTNSPPPRQQFNSPRLLHTEPRGPCSFLQQPAGQQNHPACSGRAKSQPACIRSSQHTRAESFSS